MKTVRHASWGGALVGLSVLSSAATALIECTHRFELPMTAEHKRPDDLLFEAEAGSGAGPNLNVSVEADDSRRLIYSVTDGVRTQMAVVERPDASSFRVLSQGGRGGDGSRGMDGMDGTTGIPGMSASCPSFPAGRGGDGSSGMNGGRGEDGHNGGPGGNIRVNIACSPSACSETLSLVRATVLSIGGSGGRGGPGGQGGRGGEGGPGGWGATCTDTQGNITTLLSGSGGFRGSDGLDGLRGSDGLPGPAGEVTIAVTPMVESKPDALAQDKCSALERFSHKADTR